jgi:hypothetical protein
MTDDLERRIQAAFQRANLPAAPQGLRDFLLAVPATEAPRAQPDRRLPVFLQAAAVLVAVLLTIGVLAILVSRQGLPALDASPSPTATPTGSPSPFPTGSPTHQGTVPPTVMPTAASEFPPIDGTDGWWLLWQVPPTELTPDEGAASRFGVPAEVTKLGIFVQCWGSAELTVELLHFMDVPDTVSEAQAACPTVSAATRLEFPVPAAGPAGLVLRATPDAPVTVALYVEGDGEPVTTYPSAPPLPAELADAPYAWYADGYVAVGTLDSNRQRLIRWATRVRWPIAAGDHVALSEQTPTATSLRLASISRGQIVGTLAELPPDRHIERTWVDEGRAQVFFVVGNEADNAVEVERVGLDGSGRQIVASVPAGSTVAYEFALDSSVFVVDACRARADCSRVIVDAATLEASTYRLELDREICHVIGATDGLVLVEAGTSCALSYADRTLVMSMDGSDVRVLDLALLEVAGTPRLVRTTAGPHVVAGRHVIDLSDAREVRVLEVGEDLDSAWPYVHLAPDWVLFVPFHALADVPRVRPTMTGQPPVLVNVLTGEQLELVNLPH